MIEDVFWDVIGVLPPETEKAEYIQTIVDKLSTNSIYDIYQFELILQRKMKILCNWNSFGVFALIQSPSDEEYFHDFRLWVIAKGKAFFKTFYENPELLAKELLLTYNSDLPYLQELSAVALDSLIKKNGFTIREYNEKRPFLDPSKNAFEVEGGYGFIRDLTGVKWNSDDDLKQRFPKIFDGTEGEFLREKERLGF
jgi:Protein of unknown function (DUF4240)